MLFSRVSKPFLLFYVKKNRFYMTDDLNVGNKSFNNISDMFFLTFTFFFSLLTIKRLAHFSFTEYTHAGFTSVFMS